MGIPVVLSFGMGWDSTEILLEWLANPSLRDFDLVDLCVLTSQVGHEFDDTKQLMEHEVYPRLAHHRIRTVQVARAGPAQRDGIVVLSDTRVPSACHTGGAYTLGDELLTAGTVPQYAKNGRRCTIHQKGWVLDSWLQREFSARQQPYRHIIGYNADEMRRVERDRSYSLVGHPTEYPLVEWQQGREEVERNVTRLLGKGKTLAKSACVFCPFSFARADVLRRYRRFPDAAAYALFLEHVSLALNPRMTLFKNQALWDVIKADGNSEALCRATAQLDSCEWALYRVQRLWYGRKAEPAKKGLAYRKTIAAAKGSRAEMLALLYQQASDYGVPVLKEAGSCRVYLRRPDQTYPTAEDFFVAAPATVADKCRASFDHRWWEVTHAPRQLAMSLAEGVPCQEHG